MTQIEIWARPQEDIQRPAEETRYYRIGVWEDGEWIEGDLGSMEGDTEEDIIRRHGGGRTSVAVDAVDRGDLLDERVKEGLIHREEVYDAIPAPET